MKATISPGPVSGHVRIPGSKSHTIRALIIAALAEGTSTITAPLDSQDTRSCVSVLRQLGVGITEDRSGGRLSALMVSGTGGRFRPAKAPLDCGNSGTTFYIMLSAAALSNFPVTLTGDAQIQSRSAGPLLQALESLGVSVTRGSNGEYAPVTVTGPLAGGTATVTCPTSQYLTSLLLAAPLAGRDTQIHVPLLNERPYVEMTLAWLDSQGVSVEHDGWSSFRVRGGQEYRSFRRAIPGDFSGATFFAVAAAVTGSTLTLEGVSMSDTQGDREVITILEHLGCTVDAGEAGITLSGPEGGTLSGGTFDLNAIPDALPALAVAGTACSTPLRLTNVPQARDKETDRIAVMARELTSLGARVEELPDGLVVYPSKLHGGTVSAHDDHRIAMAFSVAGLLSDSPVTVDGAEWAAVTYPGFIDDLRGCGARVETDPA